MDKTLEQTSTSEKVVKTRKYSSYVILILAEIIENFLGSDRTGNSWTQKLSDLSWDGVFPRKNDGFWSAFLNPEISKIFWSNLEGIAANNL